jgi:hypothetical protein
MVMEEFRGLFRLPGTRLLEKSEVNRDPENVPVWARAKTETRLASVQLCSAAFMMLRCSVIRRRKV